MHTWLTCLAGLVLLESLAPSPAGAEQTRLLVSSNYGADSAIFRLEG